MDSRQRVDTPHLAVNTDEAFQLSIGESATLTGTDITVTFRAVANDSRCPRRVQCIAAGSALIELDIDQNGNTTPLHLTDGQVVWTDTTRWAPIAFVPGYSVELRGLSPHPETPDSQIPLADYRATIVVSTLPALPGIPVRFTSLGSTCCSSLDSIAVLVVRDSATWRAAWRQGQGGLNPLPPLPDVDFARDMVLLIALGIRPTAGYAIDVSGVTRETSVLRVQALERQPGTDCVTAQMITQPTDMVRMPIVNAVVELSLVRRSHACGSASISGPG